MFRRSVLYLLVFSPLLLFATADPGKATCMFKDGPKLVLGDTDGTSCVFRECGKRPGMIPCRLAPKPRQPSDPPKKEDYGRYCWPSESMRKVEYADNDEMCAINYCPRLKGSPYIPCMYGGSTFCMLLSSYANISGIGECVAEECKGQQSSTVPIVHKDKQGKAETFCVKGELLQSKSTMDSYTFKGCEKEPMTVKCDNYCTKNVAKYDSFAQKCYLHGCESVPDAFPCLVRDSQIACISISLIANAADNVKKCTFKGSDKCSDKNMIPCSDGKGTNTCVHFSQLSQVTKSGSKYLCKTSACDVGQLICSKKCVSMKGYASVNADGICAKVEKDEDKEFPIWLVVVALLLCICCCLMMLFVCFLVAWPKRRKHRKFWMKLLRVWTEHDQEAEAVDGDIKSKTDAPISKGSGTLPEKNKNEAGKRRPSQQPSVSSSQDA